MTIIRRNPEGRAPRDKRWLDLKVKVRVRIELTIVTTFILGLPLLYLLLQRLGG